MLLQSTYLVIAVLAVVGAFFSLYQAAFSIWLNAHPQHDDGYWSTQFYLAAAGFFVTTIIAVVSLCLFQRSRLGRR